MKRLFKNIYQDVLELSDIEMQKENWLGKNPNHVSSYVEVMYRLFDDNGFDNFVDKLSSNRVISQVFVTGVEKLRDYLNKYQEKETNIEILQDPEWTKIVNQAKFVIQNWHDTEDLTKYS